MLQIEIDQKTRYLDSGFFYYAILMTNKIDAQITLYKINKCGLYPRGNKTDNPTFGDLESFLDDLISWTTLDDKPLKETCTFSPINEKEVKRTFCYDIKKSSLNNFLLITWNETASINSTFPTISGSSKVGEADINFTNLDPDDIPGYPSYFYIMPKENRMASISFEHSLNGKSNLEKYLKEFFSKLSHYVISEYQTNLDGEDEHVIGGWSDGISTHYDLIGYFETRLIRNKGKIEHLKQNWHKIFKMHQHNKISTKDFIKLDLISKFTKKFINTQIPDFHEHKVKFSFETYYKPKTKDELIEIIEEWNNSTDISSKWEDLGFSLEKDTGTIHWLNKSIATNEFEIPLLKNHKNIIESNSLINWLDTNKSGILKLEYNSDN